MHNLSSVEKQTKMQATTTILVIEDDLHVGYVLAQALKEKFSSKVIFATDALQALKMIRFVLPDLILLDYHLPQMDGLAFIDHLRTGIESEHIPNCPDQRFLACTPPQVSKHHCAQKTL